MQPALTPLAHAVHLLPGEPMERRDRNRAYLMRLAPENLLLSHYLEAGLVEMAYRITGNATSTTASSPRGTGGDGISS